MLVGLHARISLHLILSRTACCGATMKGIMDFVVKRSTFSLSVKSQRKPNLCMLRWLF